MLNSIKKFFKTPDYLKVKSPVDFPIVILVTILVIFGIVMIFSASYYKSLSDFGTPYHFLTKQAINAFIGFGIMVVMSQVPYIVYRRFSLLIIFVSFVLLLLLFTPLGFTSGGATRLIYIGPISIMPGEISKLAVIIFTSSYLAVSDKYKVVRNRKTNKSYRIIRLKNGIIPLVLMMAIFAALIIKQPNLSTAITVCGIISGIMFVAGLQWRYVIGVIGAGATGVFILASIGDKIGGAHWQHRLTSFLDPFEDPLGAGFQACQSLLALGSGGLFGLGLGKSIQKNLYLPEPQNDFILAIIGEELGLVGVLVLLGVYMLLIWRCVHITLNAPDKFSMLMASGITIMLGLQVILNIAIVTSVMPPTGIALPFVSFGGNSLWIFMASMGILLNISKHSREGGGKH